MVRRLKTAEPNHGDYLSVEESKLQAYTSPEKSGMLSAYPSLPKSGRTLGTGEGIR